MYTLFISTYSNLLTIGILKDDKLILKKEKESIKSHSTILIPTIDDSLKELNINTKDLSLIIVINGPGSFTGVRLGVTVAKTLAFTLNAKIKTITSIDALAISDSNLNEKIVTVKDNKGYYYGVYENNKLTCNIRYLEKESFENKYNKPNTNYYLDIEKINKYLKNIKETNPHEVKAIYIKKIEALNDK